MSLDSGKENNKMRLGMFIQGIQILFFCGCVSTPLLRKSELYDPMRGEDSGLNHQNLRNLAMKQASRYQVRLTNKLGA